MSMQATIKAKIALAATAGMLMSASCGFLDNPFADALPSESQVRIAMAGNEGGANTQALVGEDRAQFYEITYNMTRGINLLVVGLLGTTRWIVGMPPSERPDEDHAVWGPSDPSGLERLQYKAEGERLADDEFEFVLLARPKAAESEDDYREVYRLHYVRAGIEKGHGTILIDRDQHAEIEEDVCETGYAEVTFSNDGTAAGYADSIKVIDIDFSHLDRSGCLTPAGEPEQGQMGQYHYAEAEDGAGDFSFSATGNIHKGAEALQKPLAESLLIRSRWTSGGKGRSDVLITDGEIPGDLQSAGIQSQQVVATQCWDDYFISSYESTDPAELQPYILPGTGVGGELNPTGDASDCAFEAADPAEHLDV